MVLLALASVAASVPQAPQPMSAGPTVQATASIRIISGVQLRLGGENNGSNVPAARDTIFNAGNVQQPARLIEFQ